jgi:hypothetical protein
MNRQDRPQRLEQHPFLDAAGFLQGTRQPGMVQIFGVVSQAHGALLHFSRAAGTELAHSSVMIDASLSRSVSSTAAARPSTVAAFAHRSGRARRGKRQSRPGQGCIDVFGGLGANRSITWPVAGLIVSIAMA